MAGNHYLAPLLCPAVMPEAQDSCGLLVLHAGLRVSGGPQGPRLGVSVPLAPKALPTGAGAGIPTLRLSPLCLLLPSCLSAQTYSPWWVVWLPSVALTLPRVRGPAAPPQCVSCGLIFLDALGLTEDPDV